jgi:addiction module HigA family antidote
MTLQRKPTHPGAVLREDVIRPLGLTVTEAAKRLRVHRRTLSALLHEKTSLSPAMAVRVAIATKTSPESWLYMQAKLDLWNVAQQKVEVETF